MFKNIFMFLSYFDSVPNLKKFSGKFILLSFSTNFKKPFPKEVYPSSEKPKSALALELKKLFAVYFWLIIIKS